VEKMSTKYNSKKLVEWRRSEVLKPAALGNQQAEISKTLNISPSLVSKDLSYIRDQAKESIQSYLDKALPLQLEKSVYGLDYILRRAFEVANRHNNNEIQALSLALDVYKMKLELLSNSTVVDIIIKYIERQKDKQLAELQQHSTNNGNYNKVF
jgi:hypothetical protein